MCFAFVYSDQCIEKNDLCFMPRPISMEISLIKDLFVKLIVYRSLFSVYALLFLLSIKYSMSLHLSYSKASLLIVF